MWTNAKYSKKRRERKRLWIKKQRRKVWKENRNNKKKNRKLRKQQTTIISNQFIKDNLRVVKEEKSWKWILQKKKKKIKTCVDISFF